MLTDPSAQPAVSQSLPFEFPRREIAREALLLLPLFVGLFIGIWHPVQNLNEGLYARIPQEMLASGDWIVPMLNGLPYLEKPPLMYWLTAAAYAAFGVHEWAARCAPVLGMALAIGAIWRYGRAAFSRDTALYAAWIYATLPMAIVLGRTLLFDAMFTGLLAWALVLLHEHWRGEQSGQQLRWSYAFLALAVLTKGLAAIVLYGGIALCYAASFGAQVGVRRLRLLFDPTALAVFFVIAAPWHVAAALQEPGFAWFYFVNEHVLRLMGTRVPLDYHTGPWWYHLPRVAAYAFPWVLLALARPRHVAQERGRTRDPRVFLWSWFLAPLAVFSLAGEKGEYYMMIGMPAVALLIAQHAVALKRTALVVVPLGCLAALLWAQTRAPNMAPYRPPEHYTLLLFAACIVIVASIVAFWRGAHRTGLLAAGAAGFIAMALFSGFMDANADLKSARSIAAELARHPDAQAYLYEDYENLSSLPFYLRENVGVVGSQSSDLWYGMRLHPDPDRFPDVKSFAALAAQSDVWLVVHDKRAFVFQHSGLAPLFATIMRSGRVALMRSVPRGNLETTSSRQPQMNADEHG